MAKGLEFQEGLLFILVEDSDGKYIAPIKSLEFLEELHPDLCDWRVFRISFLLSKKETAVSNGEN